MTQQARILVFTGDGKGKTTAAMGMALRAVAHEMAVTVIQFAKNAETGEMRTLKKFDGITFTQIGLGFLPKETSPDYQKHKDAAQKGLLLAAEAIESDKTNMIILDEICFAVSKGLVEEKELLDILAKADKDKCIVLTGRGATDGIIKAADTVSEINPIKHAYDSGIDAQKGIEF